MASEKKSYAGTMRASFAGYVVQAIINNYMPLLFVTFQSQFGLSLGKITLLVTLNFGVQLLVDLASAFFVDRIGYRISVVAAHVLSALGLVLMAFLPGILADPFLALVIAVVVCAIGSGLIEVLVSPIVEGCPTDNKESAMSLLHSFYAWGHAAVILLSTVFFALFGMDSWWIMALIWALLPAVNAIAFTRVPIYTLKTDTKQSSLKGLFGNGLFWLLLLLMVCSGASEQIVAQWASAFAEEGLGVSKAIGDLAGPMFFAICMGLTRAFYGKKGSMIPLKKMTTLCAGLCIVAYLLMVFSPWPVLSLLGCALCGLAVGIFWPGTYSLGCAALPGGGMKFFALLALAGDLGCATGPTLAGFVSDAGGGDLKKGILAGLAFPVILLIGYLLLPKERKPVL